uniref:MATH domain-containing protein n=1 Tax=Panagrolaimus sp. PS1159 TaxID=55785 RepID=A0AC35FYI5_9BILA
MIKFRSHYYETSKISCEWEIHSYIFKTGKPAILSKTSTYIPNMKGVKWRLQAYPFGDGEENKKYFSIFLFIHSATPIHASFSVRIKENGSVEHHEFDSDNKSLGWPQFISLKTLVKNDVLKNGKFTLVFEGKLRRAFRTLKVKNNAFV